MLALLLGGTAVAEAQKVQRRPKAEKDTVQVPLYRGTAVAIDAVGAAMLAFGDYGQWEAHVRVNLRDRYFPVVEAGLGRADIEDETTSLRYKTSAPYFRAGMDYNILRDKHGPYRLYVGARMAFTSYKFDLTGPAPQDPVWGGEPDTPTPAPALSELGVKDHYLWAELLLGVDARIWGPLRLGWSVRYRQRLAHGTPATDNPYYVPGFGMQGNSKFAATFNITFEI